MNSPEPMPTLPPVGDTGELDGQDFGVDMDDKGPAESGEESEIDSIFSKLDTEKQAAVIKYAKSMVDGDAEPETKDEVDEEVLVNEILSNVMDGRDDGQEERYDKKVRKKAVTKSNPFITKSFKG